MCDNISLVVVSRVLNIVSMIFFVTVTGNSNFSSILKDISNGKSLILSLLFTKKLILFTRTDKDCSSSRIPDL